LYDKDPKRVYYLSLEFLLGRMMQNALVNLDIESNYSEAMLDLGYKLVLLFPISVILLGGNL
jgi:glycogen phosphorylase